MGGRFWTILKAKMNTLLDRAEDPNETLEYAYMKQVELLQKVKKGIANVVTSKKRLQLQSQKLEGQVVKLETQARSAVNQGRDDLARTALERKRVAQIELQNLDQQVEEMAQQQEQLTEQERQLRSRIESFRTKKEVVKAQYSAAQAQVQISEATSGIGGEMNNVGLALERASEKTENMRARAAAVSELEASGAFDDVLSLGAGQDDIDRQLAEGSGNAQIESELAALKGELGSGDQAEPSVLEQGKEASDS